MRIKIEPVPRSMSIADMYDDLVSERVYKQQWSHEQAVAEIVSKSGTHFDPVIVKAFSAEQEKFKSIAEKFKDWRLYAFFSVIPPPSLPARADVSMLIRQTQRHFAERICADLYPGPMSLGT